MSVGVHYYEKKIGANILMLFCYVRCFRAKDPVPSDMLSSLNV